MVSGTVQQAGNRTVIYFPQSDELAELFGQGATVTVSVDMPSPNQQHQLDLHAGREVNGTFELGRTAQEMQDEALGGEAVPESHRNQVLPPNSARPPTLQQATKDNRPGQARQLEGDQNQEQGQPTTTTNTKK